MKTVKLVVALLFLFAGGMATEKAEAQSYSLNYLWADSIAVTTTAKDSIWYSQNTMWQQITLWFDGTAGYVRIAAPDTASFDSRFWMYLREHEYMTIGPATKLRRLQFKGVGNGTIYMVGYKKTAQH